MNDVSADAGLETLVSELADDFLERLRRGETPSVDSYVRRHPQHESIIRNVLSSLRLMHLSGAGPAGAPAVATADLQPGVPLGDYRLAREIGRGGMGVVYEAVQLSLGRRVALKVLPFAAALDEKQLRRFKNEAHAAAHLHHQHIVPVYGVGTERGVHYYAMQYIDGQSLAAVIHELRRHPPRVPTARGASIDPAAAPGGVEAGHGRPAPAAANDPTGPYVPDTPPPAAEATLGPNSPAACLSREHTRAGGAYFRSIARLAVQAAEALEHAHQLGVIHRDIKPANLLLDRRGHLWITDFGLARFPNEVGLTASGDLLGTLRYMSPEQALGRRTGVDHRTDVYSLGVTLYELLTLEPAFPARDRNELLRQIASDDPRPARRLDRSIPADLETILIKAMAKDPAGRYCTAQEMAEDLKRFLDDQPVRARRPTLLQKSAKWARRHRSVVAATALALFAGLIASTLLFWYGQVQTEKQRQLADAQRQNAEKRFDLARDAVDEMYRQAQRWLYSEPWLAPEQQRFLGKMLDFYEEFTRETGTTPQVRRQRAVAYHRTAQIRYKLSSFRDAPPAKERALRQADDSLDQAVALLSRLVEEDPDDDGYRRELAGCQLTRGTVLKDLATLALQNGRLLEGRRNLARAESAFQLSRQFLEKLTRAGSDGRQLAVCFFELGRLQADDQQRRDEAAKSYEQAESLLTHLEKDEPSEAEPANRLAAVYAHHSYLLWTEGRTKAAEKKLRDSIKLLKELAADARLMPDYRQELAHAHQNLAGYLLAGHRLGEAESEYKEAAACFDRLAQTFPHVSRYRGELAVVERTLVDLLHRRGKLDEARAVAEAAVKDHDATLNAYPNHKLEVGFYLARLKNEFGRVLADLNLHEEAADVADQVVDVLPSCPLGRTESMVLYSRLVSLAERDCRLAPDKRTAVVKHYEERIRELREWLKQQCPGNPFVQNLLAWNLVTVPDSRFLDVKTAETLAEEVVRSNPQIGAYWNTLGVVRYRKGDWKGAVAALNKALEFNHGRDPTDQLFLAMARWQLGDKEKARSDYDIAAKSLDAGEMTEEQRRFRTEAATLLGVKKQ